MTSMFSRSAWFAMTLRGFRDDVDRVLEGQGVDDVAAFVLDVDPEPEVDDAFADVAGHQVASRHQHGLSHGFDGREFQALGVEDLLGAVAQMHEVTSHGSAPSLTGGSAGCLSAAEAWVLLGDL